MDTPRREKRARSYGENDDDDDDSMSVDEVPFPQHGTTERQRRVNAVADALAAHPISQLQAVPLGERFDAMRAFNQTHLGLSDPKRLLQHLGVRETPVGGVADLRAYLAQQLTSNPEVSAALAPRHARGLLALVDKLGFVSWAAFCTAIESRLRALALFLGRERARTDADASLLVVLELPELALNTFEGWLLAASWPALGGLIDFLVPNRASAFLAAHLWTAAKAAALPNIIYLTTCDLGAWLWKHVDSPDKRDADAIFWQTLGHTLPGEEAASRDDRERWRTRGSTGAAVRQHERFYGDAFRSFTQRLREQQLVDTEIQPLSGFTLISLSPVQINNLDTFVFIDQRVLEVFPPLSLYNQLLTRTWQVVDSPALPFIAVPSLADMQLFTAGGVSDMLSDAEVATLRASDALLGALADTYKTLKAPNPPGRMRTLHWQEHSATVDIGIRFMAAAGVPVHGEAIAAALRSRGWLYPTSTGGEPIVLNHGNVLTLRCAVCGDQGRLFSGAVYCSTLHAPTA